MSRPLVTVAVWLCLTHLGVAATVATSDTRLQVDVSPRNTLVVSLQDTLGHVWSAPDANGMQLVAWAEVGGLKRSLHWALEGIHAGSHQVVITLVCASPALVATSTWTAVTGPGPVEHTLKIMNRGKIPVLLPRQTSLWFPFRSAGLTQWWVEKSAGHPGAVGLHRGPPGVLWSTPYADDKAHLDAIPWTAFNDSGTRRGWYAGIEFSGRVQLDFRNGQADMGLTPESGYRTRVMPGQTFEAPTVFVGCYQGTVDDGANRLRRWTQDHLRPAFPDRRGPLLTNNSWGSGMGVDEPLARRMIDDSADLGLEMFHIDAGWFRGVGDWTADPVKFPHGLLPVCDYAHQRGLLLGLWVGWTQGGIEPDGTGVLNVHSQAAWFTHDYPPAWKPSDFVGADVCLADPEAVEWCSRLLERLVTDTHIDLLEHDQRMVVSTCSRTNHDHTASHTDVAYRAALGYYRVYDRLRSLHPHLLFENCVNGGRMVDYGAARRAHYFSISDAYDPLSNRQAMYDATFALPPAMCECYIQQEAVRSLPEFVAMLRSGMMGWCTVMCNTARWSREQHDAARRQFTLYKGLVRPLIDHGNLFHIAGRPDGIRWDGVQYMDPSGDHGVIFAFRGQGSTHIFRLFGLTPHRRYRVSLEDGPFRTTTYDADALMGGGLTVTLEQPRSSQLVTLYRVEDSRK